MNIKLNLNKTCGCLGPLPSVARSSASEWKWPCRKKNGHCLPQAGLILGLCPTNERRRYKVTPSLIGWIQTYNQPWQGRVCVSDHGVKKFIQIHISYFVKYIHHDQVKLSNRIWTVFRRDYFVARQQMRQSDEKNELLNWQWHDDVINCWIPHTKASDAELWCFLWSAPE